ncbi:hypothetical protein AB5N19_01645 [Seiridium cardinale]|uniref:Uncharacterized protein n=1 Tax=Seiridium cardinale TaxID=138064 RepID=A0ABR2XWN0_9PEZI
MPSMAKVRPEGWERYFGSLTYAAITSGEHDLARRLLRIIDRKKEEPRFRPLVTAVKSGDQLMVAIALSDDGFDTNDVSNTKDPIGKDHGKNHESIPDAEIGF